MLTYARYRPCTYERVLCSPAAGGDFLNNPTLVFQLDLLTKLTCLEIQGTTNSVRPRLTHAPYPPPYTWVRTAANYGLWVAGAQDRAKQFASFDVCK
jgi:hypothetical protein